MKIEYKPQTDMTLDEMIMSLTKFDEIGIAKYWDVDVYAALAKVAEVEESGGKLSTSYLKDIVPTLRALIWVHRRRTMGEYSADTAAKSISVGEAIAYFPMADPDPESEQGKDDSTEKPSV